MSRFIDLPIKQSIFHYVFFDKVMKVINFTINFLIFGR